MGTTRIVHRGQMRSLREGRGGEMSGQTRDGEAKTRVGRWGLVDCGGLVAVVWQSKEADPTVERRQPRMTVFLRARCQARAFNPEG